MALELLSEAFANGGTVPARYTCEGDNVSPPLACRGAPAGAHSLALICDDPDAPGGVFTHWLLWDLPPSLEYLPENAGAATPSSEGTPGRNDFGHARYDGPCPPRGDPPHRYSFRLYALDRPLGLLRRASRAQVLERMRGHIVAQAEVTGRFGR
ncbi:MAG: YbhB/YbcL family Raf kinase inhibitor-like protein [Anaerolineales bacterium]|nr:YbhB/YbcL family Raf kinase inhibitor-like protein [Anaerolineales bacterium]